MSYYLHIIFTVVFCITISSNSFSSSDWLEEWQLPTPSSTFYRFDFSMKKVSDINIESGVIDALRCVDRTKLEKSSAIAINLSNNSIQDEGIRAITTFIATDVLFREKTEVLDVSENHLTKESLERLKKLLTICPRLKINAVRNWYNYSDFVTVFVTSPDLIRRMMLPTALPESWGKSVGVTVE